MIKVGPSAIVFCVEKVSPPREGEESGESFCKSPATIAAAKNLCSHVDLPEIRTVALLRRTLSVQRMIFVRRSLFARSINGRL